jgi:integrase
MEVEGEIGEEIRWVFHRNGKKLRDFRGAWDSACTAAGVPGTWFHDLRRTAVRNLERAGVSRSVAMSVTGHKTESIYQRYAIADDKAIGEGLGTLNRFLETQPSHNRAQQARPSDPAAAMGNSHEDR